MPRTVSLADAQKRADQLKQQARDVLARARKDERKHQTHRKIIAGGLVWKAGLADVSEDVLLGVLMLAASHLHGSDGERWARKYAAHAVPPAPNPTTGPDDGSSLPTDQGGTVSWSDTARA